MEHASTVWPVALASLLAAAACGSPEGPGSDGGEARPDGRDGRDAPADGSPEGGDGDGGGRPRPGAWTNVVEEMRLVADRLVDLDGDGAADNALADLGAAQAELFAMAVTSLLQGGIDRTTRIVLHIPDMEDLDAPAAMGTSFYGFLGYDGDAPTDGSDDFSGEEPFFVDSLLLDPCGEPAYGFPDARVEEGELSAGEGTMAMPFGYQSIVVRRGHVSGTIAPGGASAELSLSAYLPIADLGDLVHPEHDNLTFLEILLLGGAAFGVTGMPGIAPDVDMDGDGLEVLVLDEAGQIESCVDGDRTTVPGRECWRDPRFADGFALAFALESVGARLVGPRPSWPWEVGDGCEAFPAGESLWGRCPGSECERWEAEECRDGCDRPGARRCAWDCSGLSACAPHESSTRSASSCDDVQLGGSASCADDGSSIRFVEQPNQIGGFHLPEEVVVGPGPVLVEARVQVARASTDSPGLGWALMAYTDLSGGFLGGETDASGISYSHSGYAVTWHFHRGRDGHDDGDRLGLDALDGSGDRSGARIEGYTGILLTGTLDQSTSGPIAQGLRLVIEPDDPATEANELVVAGQAETERGFRAFTTVCHGDGCPVAVHVGDRLVVGLGASTGTFDSVIELPLSDGFHFSVTTTPPCP